eukprot:4809264-Lingulodinium_polyedra.AAC.1
MTEVAEVPYNVVPIPTISVFQLIPCKDAGGPRRVKLMEVCTLGHVRVEYHLRPKWDQLSLEIFS